LGNIKKALRGDRDLTLMRRSLLVQYSTIRRKGKPIVAFLRLRACRSVAEPAVAGISLSHIDIAMAASAGKSSDLLGESFETGFLTAVAESFVADVEPGNTTEVLGNGS